MMHVNKIKCPGRVCMRGSMEVWEAEGLGHGRARADPRGTSSIVVHRFYHLVVWSSLVRGLLVHGSAHCQRDTWPSARGGVRK